MKRLCLIVALLFVTACGGSKAAEKKNMELTEETTETSGEEPTETPETALGDALPNDGTRVVGDVTTCPVSGEVFEITDESPHAQHGEGTYYFCCRNCLTEFVVNPEKFLSGDVEPHHAHDAE